jgi:hypothetical protein
VGIDNRVGLRHAGQCTFTPPDDDVRAGVVGRGVWSVLKIRVLRMMVFSQGLRAALVEQANAAAPARSRRHRWWIGASVFAGVGLVGGVGVATAGFFVEPGADAVIQMEDPVIASYVGTQTIELGPAPEGATSIFVELTCLSPGTMYWQGGASMTCSDQDVGATGATGSMSLPLTAGQRTTVVTTSDPSVSYRASVTYESRTRTEWAVNDNGDTYGIMND